ncbi:DUF547 domain-containing protein [Rhodoferax sp. PAMC 29310]|uniref:DUF547 domain-containing protein n=1 Tax=Rhodoferax sp. PAMC 29310 TaxID=2822760 RepID=UPI001B335C8F|nr:DUF547 domain-containing protein [Rhodoferax sp. PAMC 29310]
MLISRRLVLASLIGASISLPAFAAFEHSKWDALLKKHVQPLRGGQASQLDYAGIARENASFKQYLDSISAVPRATFDAWAKPEQLAFLLNAYNAWTVALVLTRYPDLKSIKDLGSLFSSPCKKEFIPLLGETRSLDDLEHKLIRGSGRYNDPRIHFAANCASVGCPALRGEAFVASKLDAQLEDAARLFLSDKTRNRVDGNGLKVSSIFKWYTGSFEQGWRGANSLGQFLALYREPLGLNNDQASRLSAGDISVSFLDYDWQLNAKSMQ